MHKTQILAAISVLGVSLGMTSTAQAAACASGEQCDSSTTNSNKPAATSGIKLQPDVFELKTNTAIAKPSGTSGGTSTEKITLHHEGLYQSTATDGSVKTDATNPGSQKGGAGAANSTIELHSWSHGVSDPGVHGSVVQGAGNTTNTANTKPIKPGQQNSPQTPPTKP